jgi:DNA polymerase III delta subunit
LPLETPLAFLRATAQGRATTPVTVFFGPQAFLREYALDRLRNRLAGDGFKYRSVQIGANDTYASLVRELEEPDLFAAKRLVVGRVLKAHRDRTGEADANKHAATDSHDEAALIAACRRLDASVRLALVYERDQLPTRIRRAFEASGTMVNCQRPFDNQLIQYAALFASVLNIKLTTKAAAALVASSEGDLATIANALNKAAITHRGDSSTEVIAIDEAGHGKIPELFEIAEMIAQQKVAEAIALFDRAMQTGRDATEVLAIELIPQIRRMLLAATLLHHRRDPYSIAVALGVAPTSHLASRAIDGARRFGLKRLERLHQRACALDASFKNGRIKQREQAVAAFILEMGGPINEIDNAPLSSC